MTKIAPMIITALLLNPLKVSSMVRTSVNNNIPVADNAVIDYHQPAIRVMLKQDVQQYSLGNNNLFTFSLNLEEAQA